MTRSSVQAVYIIVVTFAVALMLTTLPMPGELMHYRPEWVAIVLFYWVMALPHKIGISTAWVLGLILDVLKGALLGQHALALAVATFLMLHLHLRLRIYPLWQQAVVVGLIMMVYQTLLLWIYDMISEISPGWSYWLPSLVSAMLWPWLFIVLRNVRRRYQVS